MIGPRKYRWGWVASYLIRQPVGSLTPAQYQFMLRVFHVVWEAKRAQALH